MEHRAAHFALRLDRFLSGKNLPGAIEEDMDADQATLVTFSIGGSLFALPVETIDEVVAAEEIVPIPGRSTALEGMMRHREDILPIVNIRRKLGFSSNQRDGHILIARLQGHHLGLLVDAVANVLTVSQEELQKEGNLALNDSGRTIRCILNQGQQAIVVLDFQALISAGDRAHIQQWLNQKESRHAVEA